MSDLDCGGTNLAPDSLEGELWEAGRDFVSERR